MAAGSLLWRRSTLLPAAVEAMLLIAVAPRAHALTPLTPWDGSNPFHCTVQDAGKGTTVPDPGADPYCVRFDKTGQDVAQLGVVDFLLKEPARVAAAVPKCFHYQEDHWRGSLTLGGPAIYEFIGHYFFNKATGDGGARCAERLVARGADFGLPARPPSLRPHIPPEHVGERVVPS